MATLLEYDEHVVNPRFYGTAPIALPRVSPASKSRPAFAGPMRSEMVSITIGVKGHVLCTYDRHVLSDRDGGGRGGRNTRGDRRHDWGDRPMDAGKGRSIGMK